MNRMFALIAMCALAVTLTHSEVKAQNVEDEAAIRRTANDLLEEFRRKDLDAVIGFWSKTSPHSAEFKRSIQHLFGGSVETQVVNGALTHLKADAGRASARLSFGLKWHDAATRQSGAQSIFWNLQFVKESGQWKVWRVTSAISELAGRLIAAETAEGRALLLEAEKELVTTELPLVLLNTSRAQSGRGDFEGAWRTSGIALEVAKRMGDNDEIARCYRQQGGILSDQSKYDAALEMYERSLALYEQGTIKRGRAAVLNDMGIVYALTGRYKEAIGRYEMSLKIVREIGLKPAEAGTLNEIGTLYASTGQYKEALDYYETSLKIAQESGEKKLVGVVLSNIGAAYRATGRYAEALAKFSASLSIDKELGEEAGNVLTIISIGGIYRDLGRDQDAWALYLEGLRLARQRRNKYVEAQILSAIGTFYTDAGQPAKALEHYNAALKVQREVHNRAGEAATLIAIAVTHRSVGEFADALSYLEESLKIKREMGDKSGEAVALHDMGNVYAATGKYDEALERYKSSLTIAEAVGHAEASIASFNGIGDVYRRRAQWQLAADAYRKAIELVEAGRVRAVEPSFKTSFFDRYIVPYYGLMHSLLQTKAGRDEIFKVSEMMKARSLVELVAGNKSNPLKSATEQEKKMERELNAEVVAAAAQLNSAQLRGSASAREVNVLKERLNDARVRYDRFLQQLFITRPELRIRRAEFAPASLVELNRSLFLKTPGLCLLSYVANKDQIFLLVITAGRTANSPASLAIHVIAQNGNQTPRGKRLDDLLSDFRLRFTNPSGVYKPLARDLYKLLLAPAEKELAGSSHVVIIPDGVLNGIPFQVLINAEGKHLIERHSISYAPSVTALTYMMRAADRKNKDVKGDRSLFAMGRREFPDQAEYSSRELPLAEEQAESVARLFESKAFVGADATKATALARMGEARYVLFATHGELNKRSPMYSAIVLGKGPDDDGRLYARELLEMDLRAELVVLSACETGLGQQMSGEGLLGLTWALFAAGAPSSIVTQWTVRDDSMSQLMFEFFKGLKGGKTGKAEALRRAQLKLLNDGRHSHPGNWGAAVLVGDWQ